MSRLKGIFYSTKIRGLIMLTSKKIKTKTIIFAVLFAIFTNYTQAEAWVSDDDFFDDAIELAKQVHKKTSSSLKDFQTTNDMSKIAKIIGLLISSMETNLSATASINFEVMGRNIPSLLDPINNTLEILMGFAGKIEFNLIENKIDLKQDGQAILGELDKLAIPLHNWMKTFATDEQIKSDQRLTQYHTTREKFTDLIETIGDKIADAQAVVAPQPSPRNLSPGEPPKTETYSKGDFKSELKEMKDTNPLADIILKAQKAKVLGGGADIPAISAEVTKDGSDLNKVIVDAAKAAATKQVTSDELPGKVAVQLLEATLKDTFLKDVATKLAEEEANLTTIATKIAEASSTELGNLAGALTEKDKNPLNNLAEVLTQGTPLTVLVGALVNDAKVTGEIKTQIKSVIDANKQAVEDTQQGLRAVQDNLNQVGSEIVKAQATFQQAAAAANDIPPKIDDEVQKARKAIKDGFEQEAKTIEASLKSHTENFTLQLSNALKEIEAAVKEATNLAKALNLGGSGK